jgi:hypothetical protein
MLAVAARTDQCATLLAFAAGSNRFGQWPLRNRNCDSEVATLPSYDDKNP